MDEILGPPGKAAPQHWRQDDGDQPYDQHVIERLLDQRQALVTSNGYLHSIRHPIRSRTSSAPAEPAGGAAWVMSAPGSPTVIGRFEGPAGAVAMCVESDSARIILPAARDAASRSQPPERELGALSLPNGEMAAHNFPFRSLVN